MSFYNNLNQLIDQIESNLDSDIDYPSLARQAGLSLPTLQKIFPLLTGISLAEYVRNRRLTLAGRDLVQTDLRITDVAQKYGYDSTAAFSRAFQKFHGIKPSEVKLHSSQLNYSPKLIFHEPTHASNIQYKVVETPALDLYGLEILTDFEHIHRDAPALYDRLTRDFPELPHPEYGMLTYGLGRDIDDDYRYCALWQNPSFATRPGFKSYHLPPARWLKFHIPSQTAEDIQSASDRFYEEFLPTCEYQLRPDPELECYHDGTTDFLVPIY